MRIQRISSGDRTNFEEPIDRDCFRSGDNKEFKITVAKLIERIPGVKVVNCRSLERGDRKNHTLLIGLQQKTCEDAGIRITGVDPKCKLY